MSEVHQNIKTGTSASSSTTAANLHDAAATNITTTSSTTMPSVKDLALLEPCAATASMFLYAQNRSVICCHHDTLTVERTFTRHADDVQLLAVDNQSEAGGGRLVVSYDAGQTAIVWDLMTGDEVARFTSYDHLTVAVWMRNGNVAFGNTQGSITLFEPTTSEHISSRTLDQIAVTALAPSADCRTFAIGYQNGSLLIAVLQPRFTILHNLTTSRGPSPIVTLAWHASSSRQKSDMLAVQTHDGDLRVWSVAKSYSTEDPAKVVRILRRRESFVAGPNWMGWSKNGRIIQYCDSETLSWDVRTKHVTFDSIPTLQHVRGIAVYGPGASLFTLGPQCTVQQFDLNSPSIMVNNVQHAAALPPSPPNSVQEPKPESDASSVPLEMPISESDDDHLSPFARLARQQAPDSGTERSYDSGSPVSSRSGLSSLSRSSAGSRTPGRHHGSLKSWGMTENTYISAGSSLRSSAVSRDSHTVTSLSSATSSRTRHRPSRLRHEVPRSPDDSKVHDLFKFTRTRLSDVPYKRPARSDNSRLTNDDLRRQMLCTIFGWQKEVEDLVRDEMSRHPAGSAGRILLAKWLGDLDADVMAGSSENMTSSDWMLLALSGIGGHQSQHKLGRAYVQRLLECGDIHVAVTIMLGMGDHNDAIEVYISHRRYMEALILTCMTLPGVWERQAAIVRKWGEWAVQHRQQQLAIRCFACTDQESTEPWISPSATQLSFQSIPEVLSPPLSPPGVQRGPQRSIGKNSALKLITSFGDHGKKSRFFSQGDGGQTPIAAGVTPIADSAISPGGSYDAATAFLRPSSNSRFNTPTSARVGRGRLPSIGEVPSDAIRALQQPQQLEQKTPQAAAAAIVIPNEHNKEIARHATKQQEAGMSLPRAATASPMMMRDRFKRAVTGRQGGERPPSPDKEMLTRMRSNSRNGSRDRIPRGVNLHVQTEAADVTSPEASSSRYHWPTRRRGPGSVASSVTSSSSAGRSLRANGRHRDDYIHSLDAAQHYHQYRRSRSRHGSKDRARQSSRGSQERKKRRGSSRPREVSEERGRSQARGWTKPKTSPTSPIPMSPEDLANLSGSRHDDGRRSSPDGRLKPAPLDLRGRSMRRDSSFQRSPSSPLPLSAGAPHYQGSEDEEDLVRAMRAQESFRAKHGRSTSRGIKSPANSCQHERSESSRRKRDDDSPAAFHPHGRAASTEHAGDLRVMKDERQRKREQAARELEERRKSLAKRPQAPQIPHPNDISPRPPRRVGIESSEPAEETRHVPARCATEPPKRSGPPIGLPATPKAMRLIMEADKAGAIEMPPLPLTFAQRHSPNTSPDKEKSLTVLPSTVYQPPARPAIPRSMSAPIPDESHGPRHRPVAAAAAAATKPTEMRGIDEVMGGQRRRSHEESAFPVPPPPPPPPPPPMLKELQHLATMPPQHAVGGIASGTIEIVMDEDEFGPATHDGVMNKGHVRGRSSGDSSLTGRLSKATERLRSASRGRLDQGRGGVRSPGGGGGGYDGHHPFHPQQSHSHVRSPSGGSGLGPPVKFETVKRKHSFAGLRHGDMI
ncbi:hypothetical protein CP533_2342 [Ophiocordyceps camponoti-saundersi (nom. inval.)]|nr:hypothetical protein CP533_2342 [Ophiocordyceps camponoti-saundersi (nom. inval.)]